MLRWTQRRNTVQAAANTTQTESVAIQNQPSVLPETREREEALHKFASIRSNKSSTLRFESLLLSVQEELQCCICLDCFQTPRSLNCGHCFCTTCLSSIARSNQIRCPTCRKTTKLSSSPTNIEELPINYTISSIQDIVNSSDKRTLYCDTHKQEDVKFYCKTCEKLLCSECLLNEVETMEDVSDSKHGRMNHVDHQVITLKQASFSLYQDISKGINSSTDGIIEANLTVNHLRDRMAGLQHNHDNLAVFVNEQFDEIISQLNARKEALLHRITELKVSEEQKLQTELNRIENVKLSFENVIQKADGLISKQGENVRRASLMSMSSNDLTLSDRMSILSQVKPTKKDIYHLWKEGPVIKAEFEDLLKVDVKMPKYTQENYLHCVFAEVEKITLDETIHSFGKCSLTENPQIYRQIMIKGVDGRTVMCNLLEWEIHVVDLIKKASQIMKIPQSMLRLYCEGKLLYEEKDGKLQMLKDYGIQGESVIHAGLAIKSDMKPDVTAIAKAK